MPKPRNYCFVCQTVKSSGMGREFFTCRDCMDELQCKAKSILVNRLEKKLHDGHIDIDHVKLLFEYQMDVHNYQIAQIRKKVTI
jgi:REP element-mobilizing transposase RayT